MMPVTVVWAITCVGTKLSTVGVAWGAGLRAPSVVVVAVAVGLTPIVLTSLRTRSSTFHAKTSANSNTTVDTAVLRMSIALTNRLLPCI